MTLEGYAQTLVLEAAERCGISVSNEPICIEDGKNGMWAEAFVTSSVRLLVPVGGIFVPEYSSSSSGGDGGGGGDDTTTMVLKELWKQDLLPSMQRWHLLYRDIINCNLCKKEGGGDEYRLACVKL